MSKSFSPQSPRSLPPCRLCGKDNKNSPFSKLSLTWQSTNPMLHSPTSQIHLNMQLVQEYSVLMCCLETNSEAVFCRWKFCHSQLVKEDGCLLIVANGFVRQILRGYFTQNWGKSVQNLKPTWLWPTSSTLASCPAQRREIAFEQTLRLPLSEQSIVETCTEKSDPPAWLGAVANVYVCEGQILRK